MSVTEEQFFNYIRKSAKEVYEDPTTYSHATKHYLAKFKTFSDKFFFSWNWAPFCFKEIWFVFRKMYLYAFLCTIAFILLFVGCGWALALFSTYVFPDSMLPIILFVIGIIGVYFVLPAMISDYLYIRRIKKKILKNKVQKKGVSWGWAILAWFLFPTFFKMLLLTASVGGEKALEEKSLEERALEERALEYSTRLTPHL